jgi:hypothetical protein
MTIDSRLLSLYDIICEQLILLIAVKGKMRQKNEKSFLSLQGDKIAAAV